MRKIVCLNFIFICASVFLCYGQVMYENIYSDNGANAGYAIKPTNDHGYIIAGFCNPTSTFFGQDYLLMKIDSLGVVEWANNFGGISSDHANNVIQTSDSGFAEIGVISGASTISDDIYLVKTDNSGNLLWSKEFGETEDDFGYDLKEIPSDSGFIIAANRGYHPYIIRTDKYGDTLWTKSLIDSANIYSMCLTSDNGFLAVGATALGPLGIRGFVIKLDQNGNLDWKLFFEGGGGEELYGCTELANGNFAVAGRSLEDSPPPKTDAIIRFINPAGTFINYETFGSTNTDYFHGIVEANDGNGVVMTGRTYIVGENVDQDRLFAVKTDLSGIAEWEMTFGQDLPESETGYDVCQAYDGGYVFCGQKTNADGIYVYIVKVNEFGSTVSTIEIPQFNSFALYPNPMSEYSKIEFGKPLEEKSDLKLYAINGQLVYSEELPIGTLEHTIYKNNLVSGIYLLSIKSGKTNITKRLIVE